MCHDLNSLVKYTSIVLGIIIIVAGYSYFDGESPKKVSVNDLKVEITTNKEVYNVGEEINGTIWFVNTSPDRVYLDAIYTAYFSGNYADDPNPVSAIVNIDYASSHHYIDIPAGERVGFLPIYFVAKREGVFTILSFGASKSVRVVKGSS